MKTFRILTYAVVLWTLVELGDARQLRRSLEVDVEGRGSNLTEKRQQEAIHADILQHFTSPPTVPSESLTRYTSTRRYSTIQYIRDVPVIPEEINVQRLKNDDHEAFDTRNQASPTVEAVDARNKTARSNRRGVSSYKYNQSRTFSPTRSKVHPSYSSHERSSAYNDDSKSQEVHTYQYQPIASSTETYKVEGGLKSFETKKKGKKEILDSVTVPTDNIGAGRIEKAYKDSLINIKLKEKNKESISEALDERRSTTRFSNSSSFSVSELDNSDNHKLPSSFDIKLGLSGVNEEKPTNQSVNSVINSNGVNSDSLKKLRVKYSVKRAQNIGNDTVADNTSTSGNLLSDHDVKQISHSNLEPQATPPSSQTTLTNEQGFQSPKRNETLKSLYTTDSTPTKVDLFSKLATPVPTSAIKPSIAFKQLLANKLKGLEPSPTAPVSVVGNTTDQIPEKSKSSTKSNFRKKPKLDYHTSSSEINYSPTATAWTLLAMKSAVDSLRTSLRPVSTLATRSSSEETPTPATYRVKTFLPWSTRLRKNTSWKPPVTVSIDEINSTERAVNISHTEVSSSSHKKEKRQPEPIKLPEYSPPSSTTQSVIRTTEELDRNTTETSINVIQSSADDVMVRDQPSTLIVRPIGPVTTEIITKNSTVVVNPVSTNSTTDIERERAEKENAIETKASEENENHSKVEDEPQEKVEEKSIPSSTGNTFNEEQLSVVNENVNEVKPSNLNETVSLTTLTPQVEIVDTNKMKSSGDANESHTPTTEILVDGQVEDEVGEALETTVMPDLEEDAESDSDREDEELAIIIDKLPLNQTVTEAATGNLTDSDSQQLTLNSTSSLPTPENDNNATYATSFDFVPKDNASVVVTKSPSEGDINWYNVDTKPVPAANETDHKAFPEDITTTSAAITTNELETTTETSEQESTVIPDTTAPVLTVTTTTSAPVTEPELVVDEGSITDEELPSCASIMVHVSPAKLCHGQQQLRQSIAAQIMTEDVTWDQVLIMNGKLQECEEKQLSDKDELMNVNVCFLDKNHQPSPTIRDEFVKLYAKTPMDSNYPVVELHMTVQPPTMTSGLDNVLAAIVLSVIAAVCLVLLGILLVIIRKRQGRFNYGQRCTPVSLDDYSLDNISVYNSIRRKGALRASKRSYGNPAFDDPVGPAHAINFAGLANFSSDRAALDEEYSQIPMITVKPDELPSGAENKNRYANVIPLPETRVLIQAKPGAETLGEYINANYIKGTKGPEKLYIACQAPLQTTVEDFWRMVWQEQTKVVLMLTALNENGVEKCADYFPQVEITDCNRLFGDFQVTLKKHEVREKYIISSLQLKNLESNLWREVTHMWYTSWPAQGVPDDGSAMIAFLIEARSYMRGAQGPTVVHCSPGTGRTGTVIAIDLCIRDFETLRTVDIPKTVYSLRRDRAGAVQTKDQYAFIYQVLNLYATKLTGGGLDSI